MLTQLQKQKLTHYFNMLDFDRNGTIEKEDFTGIAENLCILWNLHDDSSGKQKIVRLFEQSWITFRQETDHKDTDHATLDEWLNFADKHIVNGSDAFFTTYVREHTSEIFDLFDVNRDGFIALDEYIDMFMAYHIPVRYSAKSYIKLDLNNDDLLSKAELLKAMEEFFKSDDEKAPGNWLFGFWRD